MSECNACFYCGDYEGPEFYAKSTRKARKQHRCDECGEIISVGSLYEYVSGRWDGKINHFRTCLPCVEIRDAFACDGYIHASLWDNIYEGMFESFTTGCLQKLTTAAAKEKLMAQWRDWKGLA